MKSLSGWNCSTRSYRPLLDEILLLLLQKQAENDELLKSQEMLAESGKMRRARRLPVPDSTMEFSKRALETSPSLALRYSYLRIRTLVEVNALDKPHFALAELH